MMKLKDQIDDARHAPQTLGYVMLDMFCHSLVYHPKNVSAFHSQNNISKNTEARKHF